MNTRELFDQGATVGQVATDARIPYAVAAYVCQPPAPKWPTWTPEQLARLPEHLQQMIKTS